MAAATTTQPSRILIERITARVFCQHGTTGGGGGNPVTVFATQGPPLPSSTQKYLAKECDWESVMVSSTSSSSSSSSSSKTTTSNNQKKNSMMSMSFYMPSGQEVSFCAHAALGGSVAVGATKEGEGEEEEELSFQTSMATAAAADDNNNNNNNTTGNHHNHKSHTVQILKDNIACLNMTVPFEMNKISHPPGLQRLLREHLGLSSQQLNPFQVGKKYPTFTNASVARPKTLVYVNSLDALHKAKTPKVVEANQRFSFASACDSIDQSTGIYLYTKKNTTTDTDTTTKQQQQQYMYDDDTLNTSSWECRQFPRSSGYPEDPATGIAAAALAGSLFLDGVYTPKYKFYQGTIMGRPSLIEVINMKQETETETEETISSSRIKDENNETTTTTNDEETTEESGMISNNNNNMILLSFGLQGKVEIDERDMVEVDIR